LPDDGIRWFTAVLQVEFVRVKWLEAYASRTAAGSARCGMSVASPSGTTRGVLRILKSA
jgi:hypothetical protein